MQPDNRGGLVSPATPSNLVDAIGESIVDLIREVGHQGDRLPPGLLHRAIEGLAELRAQRDALWTERDELRATLAHVVGGGGTKADPVHDLAREIAADGCNYVNGSRGADCLTPEGDQHGKCHPCAFKVALHSLDRTLRIAAPDSLEHAALQRRVEEARAIIEIVADFACENAIDDANGEDCLERNVAPEDRCVHCAARAWLSAGPETVREEKSIDEHLPNL